MQQNLATQKNPDLLLSDATAKNYDWVIIDEVQKIPKLLDIVHKSMVEKKYALL